MMTAMMTRHVAVDRLDRVLAIAQHIGWGTELVSIADPRDEGHMLVLTSTGVLLVKSYEGHLVTAFVPGIDKVRVIYAQLGYDHVPNGIYYRVQKSIKMMRKLGF